MEIVSRRERDLKWPILDWLELILIVICGLLLTLFTFAVFVNVVTRELNVPILWLQELITAAFIWGIFLGGSVAVRRNEHFRLATFVDSLQGYWRLTAITVIELIMLVLAGCLIVFGWINFLQGFHNYMEPSGTPIAVVTAAVPTCGVLCGIFALERLWNAWSKALGRGAVGERAARATPMPGTR